MTVAMTRTFLIALLIAVFAGCDTITTEQSQGKLYSQPDDVLMIAKKSPEEANQACRINPYRRKCAEWCASPESDCGENSNEPKAAFDFAVDGLEVQFSNDSKNSESYAWDFGDGAGSTGENPHHTYAQEGTYSVTLTVSNEDGTDSITKPVTVTEDAVNPCEDGCPVGPNEIPSDRTDLGGGGWDNDLPPVPNGVIVFTGYSNSAQIASTFINRYADDYDNYTFINCALGSNALENWVSKDLAASCANSQRQNVVLTVNMIASQFATSAAASQATIASNLPQLDAQLRAQFPNAIHAYYGGEPAHFVEPGKCPRICEPIRKLASDWAAQAARTVGGYLGPYVWAGGNPSLANASGVYYVIEDFLNPQPDGTANQHPSNQGRAKVAAQYHTWFGENGID